MICLGLNYRPSSEHMDTPPEIRETIAGVMLKRLVEQFTLTNRDTMTFETAIASAPPDERGHFKEAFQALVEYKLLAEKSGEFFITQYGALFLEHAQPTFERRQLPFTDEERRSALNLLREAVSSDSRFNFHTDKLSQPYKARPPVIPEAAPAVTGAIWNWVGLALLIFFVWGIFKALTR